MRQSPVSLRFGTLLCFDQSLCQFFHLVFYGIGKGFLDTLDVGFQLGVFLFNRCGFADPDNTADTVKYAVHLSLAPVFELPFLIGNLIIQRKAVLFFHLVLALNGLPLGFGFLLGGKGGILFGFDLFGFLFLFGDDEVVSFQMLLACQLL